MKIRAHLAWMSAGIFVPVILFSALALKTLFDAQRESAFRALRETARVAATALDREFAVSEASLRVLAHSNALEAEDLLAFYDRARLIGPTSQTWIVVVDARGQQVINTRVAYGTHLPAVSRPEEFHRRLALGQPWVSNLLRGPVSAHFVTYLAYPVTIRNGNQYVLYQAFAAEYFARVFPKLRPSWLIGLFDREGRTVIRAPARSEFVGRYPRQPLLSAILAGQETVFRNQSRDALDVYTVVTRVKQAGWSVAVGVPQNDIEAPARHAVTVAALGLLAALVLATLSSLLFARRLRDSIRGAVESATLLGQGVLPPEKQYRIDEFTQLQEAQVQAGHLLADERKIRQKTEAERAEIAEREAQAQALVSQERAKLLASEQQARQQAEQQNQLKDQFLAMLGHELRNPMSAISGAIAILDLSGVTEERQQRARQILKRQMLHLTRIVDDLLDLARVVTGKLTLHPYPVDLGEVARTCVETFNATGRTGNHAVSLNAASVWVNADKTRLDQIINNLLGNAIKYTPAGKKIDITVAAEEDHAVLTVRDEGIGISPELLPRLFEVFVQADASLDRAQGGLGLGLALVDQLARLHGGAVSVHSAGIGAGSTFTLRLPIATPLSAPPGSEQEGGTAAREQATVLVVDDNADARQVTAELLEAEGWHIAEAEDGPAAIAMATKIRPAVAIVDIGLPGMNGYEVASALRAEFGERGIRLIALTGYGQQRDREQALNAGFDRHFTKPVAHEILLAALRAPASPNN